MNKLEELIFIPLPGMGNLVPMVETAKTLVDRDQRLFITVLIMNLPSVAELAAYIDDLVATSATSEERIKFIDLSKLDGYDPSAESNPGMLKSLFIENQKPHVKNVVAELIRSKAGDPNSSRLAGFVVDMFCTVMMDVAAEFRVPAYVYYASGAAFLGLMFHFQALYDDDGVDPTEFEDDPVAEFAVPSFVEPVPATSLPKELVLKGRPPLLFYHTRKTREAKGILVNSFTELETHALRSLSAGYKAPPVYPVGPIIRFSSVRGTGGFADISKWLDDQPLSSVVFLCFGSKGSFRETQLKEIACALEHSGVRFLWSLRRYPPRDKKKNTVTYASPQEYSNPRDVLSSEFFDRTAERGKVIGWAPQAEVLAHPAIGGFVSHCGWNSTLESIWFGVPMVMWPLHAEQHLNAFELVKELRLAVEIKLDYKSYFYGEVSDDDDDGVVRWEEIESGIRRLMEHDSEIRKRVKELSEKSKRTVLKGGSSYSSMDLFINDVIGNCT
ncbi:anthocyanidin 3-O-glucosyltransferase 2-like [Humulus lupulus]|uniref:anthocyanidin 3-O-glucosyltransferase 2-like n=1 Tax=Humulus lupulus TaxID=3486 RepID=UPI002B40AAD7|nr:anthocyanidin 3-O-glucosyltransferase 2-like [Humulus lupulus]